MPDQYMAPHQAYYGQPVYAPEPQFVQQPYYSQGAPRYAAPISQPYYAQPQYIAEQPHYVGAPQPRYIEVPSQPEIRYVQVPAQPHEAGAFIGHEGAHVKYVEVPEPLFE